MVAVALMATGLAWAWQRTPRVRGKVVVVTGASRGLGLEIGRELCARGAYVLALARDPDELARAVVSMEQRGGRAIGLPCDVTVRDQVEAAIAIGRRRLGPIDAVVNNAGRIEVAPAEHLTDDDFRASMDTHFWGPLHVTRAVLPDLRRRRGRVVNITSIGGVVAVPHLSSYTASKHALVGLSRGMHAELGRHGVAVTTVIPGLLRTGSPRNAFFKGRHRREYTWFALADGLPGISMSVRRAARRVVDALERGEAEVVLGRGVRWAQLAQALAPGLVAAGTSAAERWLPAPGGIEDQVRRGSESETLVTRSPALLLSRIAERTQNQR